MMAAIVAAMSISCIIMAYCVACFDRALDNDNHWTDIPGEPGDTA